MKDLSSIMREQFIKYLLGINVDCKPTMKLSELIALAKKHNDSNPQIAIGIISQESVRLYENQNSPALTCGCCERCGCTCQQG